MTTINFVQIACEGTRCGARYPEQPAVYDTAAKLEVKGSLPSAVASTKTLRVAAASMGWEVQRGAHGRDLCPACRIGEIQRLSGHALAVDGGAA